MKIKPYVLGSLLGISILTSSAQAVTINILAATNSRTGIAGSFILVDQGTNKTYKRPASLVSGSTSNFAFDDSAFNGNGPFQVYFSFDNNSPAGQACTLPNNKLHDGSTPIKTAFNASQDGKKADCWLP